MLAIDKRKTLCDIYNSQPRVCTIGEIACHPTKLKRQFGTSFHKIIRPLLTYSMGYIIFTVPEIVLSGKPRVEPIKNRVIINWRPNSRREFDAFVGL